MRMNIGNRRDRRRAFNPMRAIGGRSPRLQRPDDIERASACAAFALTIMPAERADATPLLRLISSLTRAEG
jgi:hypothetical protein